MSLFFYQFATLLLFLLAIRHFFKFNDEFLFLPVFFFYLTGISRYMAIVAGKATWVSVAYTRNIFTEMTLEKGMWALGLFFLGTIVFSLSYSFYHGLMKYPDMVDNDDQFSEFVKQKRRIILGLFVFFVVLNSVFKGLISGSLAYGNSYFFYFGMAIAGLILLAYLVYKSFSFSENFFVKLFFLLLMVWGMYISYNPSLRFQFVSWMVALGILMTRNFTPWQKAKYYVMGGIGLFMFFALAGVARNHNLSNLSWKRSLELVTERSESKSDQNMLDGFMMVLDVYPKHLNFSYGMEHVEILMRPIPRQLWPGKPVGGYHNKLGLNNLEYGTVGISQTIYGSFYGEGGAVAIILFSIIYGWLFVKLFRYAIRYESDMKWLLKGVIIASFIPILRGGDLPGIIAFIGMSYWPVFVLLWMYNRWLKEKGQQQQQQQQQQEQEQQEQQESEEKHLFSGLRRFSYSLRFPLYNAKSFLRLVNILP